MLGQNNKRISSRRDIAIEAVDDGLLILPGGKYRMILKASSINFELMSEEEQDALIDTYQSFLNSLSTPLQVLIRVREMNIDDYLDRFKERVASETDQIYTVQAQSYSEFVRTLVTKNKILTRHFYIVVSYDATTKKEDLTAIRERLLVSVGIISKGLARLGVQTHDLGSLEILDLFYQFYSPASAKRQSISDQTIRLFSEALI